MSELKAVVLDVLKPHNPTILELSKKIAELKGVDGCNIRTVEIDKDVENIKISVVGSQINFQEVENIVEKMSGSIHSVDKVSCGKPGKPVAEEISTKGT